MAIRLSQVGIKLQSDAPDYKARVSYALPKINIQYQYIETSVNYQAVNATGVLLDPYSNNRYLRDDQVSFIEALAFDSTKLLTDATVVADLPAISLTRPAADSFGVYDIAALTVQFVRDFADQAGAIDAAPIFTIGKAAFDTIAPTELLAVALDKPLQDTYSIADSLERAVDYNRAFTDFVSIDDNATVGGVEKDTQAVKVNIVAMAEEHLYSFGKVLSDAAFVTDSPVSNVGKVAVDGIGVSEAAVVTAGKGLQDAVTFFDSQIVDVDKVAEDSAVVTDAPAFSTAKPVVDSISGSDLAAITFNTGFNNAVNSSDVFGRVVSYTRAFTDFVSIDDNATVGGVEKDTQAVKTNIVAMVEQHACVFGKQVADSTTAADSAAIGFSRPVADSLSASDNLAMDSGLSHSDSATTSDSQTLSVDKRAIDSVVLSEARQFSLTKPLFDSFNSVDLAAIQFNTSFSDSTAINDELVRTVAYSREFTDFIAIDDNATVGGVEKETQASKANIVAMSEAHTYTFSKKVFDPISVAEAARRAVSKTLADTVDVSELLVIETTAIRQSSVINAGAFNTYAFNY